MRRYIRYLLELAGGSPFSAYELGRRIYGIGACAALMASMCVFAIGLINLLNAVKLTFLDLLGHDKTHGGISALLHALEFGFLAPMPFLIYWGACRLIADVLPKAGGGPFSSDISESSERNLEIVKGMVIALIIGVFATDVLGKAMSEEGISISQACAHAVIMLVLTLFIWVIKPTKHACAQAKPPP